MVFLIVSLLFYLEVVVRASSRYYFGESILPSESINWREKSLTTQINCGLVEEESLSIELTKFKTKLKVWRAVSSMLPKLLYTKVVDRRTAKENIFISWLDSSSSAAKPYVSITSIILLLSRGSG